MLLAVVFTAMVVRSDFLELKNGTEFEELIKNSNVPVVVQFSAYWCGPCQNLKAVFKKVAPSYSDSDVKLAYVDAYVNSQLKKYLQGGYPTVRTFNKGELTTPAFVGSNSESYVRNFIDKLIKHDDLDENVRIGAYCIP